MNLLTIAEQFRAIALATPFSHATVKRAVEEIKKNNPNLDKSLADLLERFDTAPNSETMVAIADEVKDAETDALAKAAEDKVAAEKAKAEAKADAKAEAKAEAAEAKAEAKEHAATHHHHHKGK